MVTETKPKPRSYTEDERRQIIEMHMDAHNGIFHPHELVEDAESPIHPAHDYFEWDNSAASFQYRVWQARRFAHVKVIQVPMGHTNLTQSGTTITVEKQPLMVVPMASRGHGGGYVATDSEEGQRYLLEESAAMGRTWLVRFRGVLTRDEIEDMERILGSIGQRLQA